MTNILTNKHLITALIVSPILAFIAYYAVDYNVSEKPHQAVDGQSYPLVAKSNCRYESGKCTLNNGDVDITLIAQEIDTSTLKLSLTSNHPIQGAKVALTNEDNVALPETMQAIDQSQVNWQVTLPNKLNTTSRLQIALALEDSVYFGETTTIFTSYKTIFPQDNIAKH